MQTSFEYFKNSLNESKTKPTLTNKEMRDFLLNYLEDNKYAENEKLLKRDLADFIKVTKAVHKLSKEDVEKLKAYAESKLAKEKVDKKKKAVKENFQSSMSLGDNFNDIMSDLTMVNDLFENEYLNGQLDIAEGYTIDDIMDHLTNEFGMDDEDEFYQILAKTKKAIIAYDSPVNNESLGSFFSRNWKIKYLVAPKEARKQVPFEKKDDKRSWTVYDTLPIDPDGSDYDNIYYVDMIAIIPKDQAKTKQDAINIVTNAYDDVHIKD